MRKGDYIPYKLIMNPKGVKYRFYFENTSLDKTLETGVEQRTYEEEEVDNW